MAVNRSSFITVHQEAIVFTAQISDIRAHCQLQFIHHENNDVFAHLLLHSSGEQSQLKRLETPKAVKLHQKCKNKTRRRIQRCRTPSSKLAL